MAARVIEIGLRLLGPLLLGLAALAIRGRLKRSPAEHHQV